MVRFPRVVLLCLVFYTSPTATWNQSRVLGPANFVSCPGTPYRIVLIIDWFYLAGCLGHLWWSHTFVVCLWVLLRRRLPRLLPKYCRLLRLHRCNGRNMPRAGVVNNSGGYIPSRVGKSLLLLSSNHHFLRYRYLTNIIPCLWPIIVWSREISDRLIPRDNRLPNTSSSPLLVFKKFFNREGRQESSNSYSSSCLWKSMRYNTLQAYVETYMLAFSSQALFHPWLKQTQRDLTNLYFCVRDVKKMLAGESWYRSNLERRGPFVPLTEVWLWEHAQCPILTTIKPVHLT